MKPLIAVSPETVRQLRQQYGGDAALIGAAMECFAARFRDKGAALSSPSSVRDYLRLLLTPLQHEVFIGIFLDAQNRVLAVEELFRGTLTQTSVHPREVVKKALQHNAAGLILAHNHPSGLAEPSMSDIALTDTLKQALALVDVSVLDHFVVAAGAATSLAERGLLTSTRHTPAATALPRAPDPHSKQKQRQSMKRGKRTPAGAPLVLLKDAALVVFRSGAELGYNPGSHLNALLIALMVDHGLKPSGVTATLAFLRGSRALPAGD